jgi:hypothetical protein
MALWSSVSNPLRAGADRLRERFQSWGHGPIVGDARPGDAGSANSEGGAAGRGSTERDDQDRSDDAAGKTVKNERASRTTSAVGTEDRGPDGATTAGSAASENRRSREKRRGKRRVQAEPPAARFLMIAPGRYVRVEEPRAAVADPLPAELAAGDEAASHPVDETVAEGAGEAEGTGAIGAPADELPEAVPPDETTGNMD